MIRQEPDNFSNIIQVTKVCSRNGEICTLLSSCRGKVVWLKAWLIFETNNYYRGYLKYEFGTNRSFIIYAAECLLFNSDTGNIFGLYRLDANGYSTNDGYEPPLLHRKLGA